MEKKSQFDLTYKYLSNKLRQAQEDVNIFTLMLEELKKSDKDRNSLTIGNQFLKLVKTNNENN